MSYQYSPDVVMVYAVVSLTLYQPMTANAVMTFVNSPYAYGNLYGVFNTRRYTLVHGFYFFKLFLMVGKESMLFPHAGYL